jgi:hypothetical protein
VVAAVRGGATAVQLRDKRASDAELIEQGKALKAALADTPVPLIVNDRLKVAAAIGADGLHLGQSDGELSEARAVLGAEAILGLSVQRLDQLQGLEPRWSITSVLVRSLPRRPSLIILRRLVLMVWPSFALRAGCRQLPLVVFVPSTQPRSGPLVGLGWHWSQPSVPRRTRSSPRARLQRPVGLRV